jgi:hypothetical protein
MSELPLEAQALRFARGVIAASRKAGGGPPGIRAAEQAAADREEPAVQAVLEAAYKTGREIDRLMGLLRFNPNRRGLYVARCSPDHFVLPGLGEYFLLRFGGTPWAIIDEKRGLCLCRFPGTAPGIFPVTREFLRRLDSPGAADGGAAPGDVPGDARHPPDLQAFPGPAASPAAEDLPDPWEELWRNYHRSVNNENRKNPDLQRQFMPRRYWKYLPEMKR